MAITAETNSSVAGIGINFLDNQREVGAVVLFEAVEGISHTHKPSRAITHALPKDALIGRDHYIIRNGAYVTISAADILRGIVPVLPDNTLAEFVLLPFCKLILIDTDDFYLILHFLIELFHLRL